MRIVLDINVIVSGIVSGIISKQAAPGRLLASPGKVEEILILSPVKAIEKILSSDRPY